MGISSSLNTPQSQAGGIDGIIIDFKEVSLNATASIRPTSSSIMRDESCIAAGTFIRIHSLSRNGVLVEIVQFRLSAYWYNTTLTNRFIDWIGCTEALPPYSEDMLIR